MKTLDLLPARPSARVLAAVPLIAVLAYGATAPLALADCELPVQASAPSAGEYKGFFRLSCEMHLPASPTLVIPVTFEGDLVFDLGRQELDDAPPPVPPPRAIRRPLRPPAAPRSGPPDPAAVEAVNEAASVEAALAAALNQADPGHLYIPPSENPRVEGTSNVSVDARFQHVAPEGQLTGQVGTKRTMPFEVRGEESSRTGTFDELTLWGTQDQAAFAGGFNFVTPDARGTGNLDFSDSGATGSVTAEDKRGSISKDVNISTGGAGTPPPGEDKYQRERREFDEAYDRLFGKPEKKVQMLTLTVTSTDCFLLRGTVRAEQFEAQLKQQGAVLVVKESEWMATLQEREPDFEKRVQSLAAEPIPSPLTWGLHRSVRRALEGTAQRGHH